MATDLPEKSGIGARLRAERERLGLGQLDLAEAGGVNRNTQGAYEKGERSPDAAYLAAAAKLGVDVLYVVTGLRAGSARLGDETAGLLGALDRIAKDQRAAIEVLVRALDSAGTAEPVDARGAPAAVGSSDVDLALWRSVALSIPGTPDLDGSARLTAEQWLEIVDGGYRLAQRNAADRRTAEQDAAKVLKKARDG